MATEHRGRRWNDQWSTPSLGSVDDRLFSDDDRHSIFPCLSLDDRCSTELLSDWDQDRKVFCDHARTIWVHSRGTSRCYLRNCFSFSGPAHTVGSIGSGPDQLFRFFFFFLSFEANGFARGLKLNEIEHYKLDKSKGRCPRETFFVSSFSAASPHARRRHPSLRYNFSRHLLSIFHIIYILSTYKTHSGPQHIPAHATLRPRCHP